MSDGLIYPGDQLEPVRIPCGVCCTDEQRDEHRRRARLFVLFRDWRRWQAEVDRGSWRLVQEDGHGG